MNLSRNVQITGQDVAHRSHVFIRATVPQTIKNAELRYMGPRKDTNGDGKTERILGRYPLHFHMMSRAVTYDLGDGSKPPVRNEVVQPGPNSNGSIVDGVVVREAGSHAFVAHESDGVAFRNLVGYNVIDTAFWWDDRAKNPVAQTTSNGLMIPASISNNIAVENSIMARVLRKEANGKEVELIASEVGAGARLSGYMLGTGTGNLVKNSVVAGVDGSVLSDGFEWPEGSDSLWGFSSGNIAHNNLSDGLYVWENNFEDARISNVVSYNNGRGVVAGAYRNQYRYDHLTLVGNKTSALQVRAVSSTATLNAAFNAPLNREIQFNDSILEGSGISNSLIQLGEQKLDAEAPVWFTNVRLNGQAAGRPKVLIAGSTKRSVVANFAYCTVQPAEFSVGQNTHTSSKVRVYNSASDQFQLTPSVALGPSGYATKTTGSAGSFVPPAISGEQAGALGPWPVPMATAQ